MKSRRRYVKWIAVALSLVVAFLLIGMCGLAFLYQRQLDQARAQYAPPTVYVSQPLSGSSAPAGSQLAVSATAWGEVPITRAELWLNGQLADTQECDLPEGISPFHAHFGLLVSEGPQQLFVRAFNAEAIIGQSVPVGVTGEAAADEGLVAVVVDPGQSLEDVAAAHGIEPEAVRELNPGLRDQEPPAGTEVIVPAPAAPAPPGPQAPPVGPAIPPGPGTPSVTGTVPMPPGVVPLTPILPGPNMTGTFPVTPILPVPNMTGTVPLTPILPVPNMTGTVPLPVIVGSLLPQLAVPVFTPPAAPTDLQGMVEDCLIRLRWQDNTTNELRYDVWLAPMVGSPRLITSLAPAKGGAAWFEFPAPQTGGLSFWVEAVGLGGKQLSNIVWLEVNPQCPTTSPTRLQVEALDMSVRGSYDKAYCYVSFENIPEERLPQDDSAFIKVQGGQGNIATWASGNRKFLVPIPADGALDMSGECWGWSGEELSKLGTFSDTTNSSQWTGTRLPLLAEGYEIGYAVTYAGEAGGEGKETTYAYEDPSMPSPYNLTMLGKSSPGVPGSSWTALHWDWNGDEKTITGFAVFLDGQPFATIFGADKRGIGVNPPTGCDKRQRWQVAAVAGEAQSRLSAVYEYRTPECPVSVEVKFEEIEVKCVDTSWFNPVCPSCDTVECWFRVFANDQSAQRFSFNFPMKLSCETWKINWSQWPDPPQNTLTVQIGPSDTSLQFGSRWFYENSFGELAKFQEASRTISMTLDQWKTYQGEHRLCPGKQAGVMSCLVVKIRGPEVSVL